MFPRWRWRIPLRRPYCECGKFQGIGEQRHAFRGRKEMPHQRATANVRGRNVPGSSKNRQHGSGILLAKGGSHSVGTEEKCHDSVGAVDGGYCIESLLSFGGYCIESLLSFGFFAFRLVLTFCQFLNRRIDFESPIGTVICFHGHQSIR